MDTLVLQFLESEVKVAGASQAMLTLGKHPGHLQKAPEGVKGLHLTAYFGLRSAAIELLKKVPCIFGDAEMTEFFLSQGADPNALSHYRETPLHPALSKSIQGPKYEDAWNELRWRLKDLWDVVEFYDEDAQEEVATQITKREEL
ncbi:hypothetical protein B7494_g5158 [Chlorociboria aeruginascens]|nr:hypothetical protein B7494_g5158 [Chlorociboria aeruginascens]